MGIIGIGIDIIEIKRIQKAAARPKFLDIIFTEDERKYFNSRNNNICHIAGTFAAKEAVSKALGTGFKSIGWREIEILRGALGEPEVHLMGSAKVLAQKKGIEKMHISISHSRDFAVSAAIAEGDLI
jgi:holo-[acyl-carrier protein] synthase